jgi:regulator of chromosome condensation
VQNTPFLVSGLPPIVQITCGANHALALDSIGNIWAWGAGEQNQLGRRILGRHQTEAFKPRRVEIARNNTKYIASGQYHSFAIDGKDNVWAVSNVR